MAKPHLLMAEPMEAVSWLESFLLQDAALFLCPAADIGQVRCKT
jgi:hypothetical protein